MLPPLLGGRQCCPGMFDFDPSQLTRKGGWGHTGVHASTVICMHAPYTHVACMDKNTSAREYFPQCANVRFMTRDVFVFHHRKKCHSLELIMIINTNKYRF